MCGGWGVPEGDELSPDDGGCGKKKATDAGIDKTKRGFTTAAMASPVLMSLLSKPAWSNVACSISGLTSGNVSSPGGVPGPCSGDGIGCTPGFWKNNPEAWVVNTPYSPGSCISSNNGGQCQEWNTEQGTSFHAAFGCVAPGGDPGLLDTPTMMDLLILADKSNDINHAWQAHWIAALLNATASPTYGSSPGDIIASVCGVIAGTLTKDDGDPLTAADLHEVLVYMNERDCPINAHGFCGGSYVNNVDGVCIPSCSKGYLFDVNAGFGNGECVLITDWVQGTGVNDPDNVSCSIEEAINGKEWCKTTTLT